MAKHAALMAVNPSKQKDVAILLDVLEAGFEIVSSVPLRSQIVYALTGTEPLPAALLNKVEVRE